jgi:hypothetical protein
MIADLEKMKADIRSEFETVLDFVTGEQARIATADQIERGLFTLLLSLGAKLLLLFFQMRTQACSRDPITLEDGQTLPYHSEQKRIYFSVFDRIPLWRPYFYQSSLGGQAPLDAELDLGSDRYSDLLRDLVEYLAVYVPSYGKAMSILARILEFKVSTRAVQEMVAEDALDVEAYYAQKPPPDPKDEAEILVIQADGKGVPMVLEQATEPQVRLGKGQKRGRKKEAIVTTVYTIASNPRTPEAVVASFFHQDDATERNQKASSPPSPQNKHVWATLDGKDAALTRLTQQVEAREGEHIQEKVALTDGDPALQQRVEIYFPDFELILDFIHPNEYLWEVANSLFGETDERRNQWVADQTLLMLSGQTEQIIADFRTLAEAPQRTKRQREKLTKTANYFENNLSYMHYQTYLAKGWPIASGVVEGACRHFVKDRFELSGMRWTQEGAENLFRLRAVAENGDWETYLLFRRRQRHERLYSLPFPEQGSLEFQALEPHAPPGPHQPRPAVSSRTTTQDELSTDSSATVTMTSNDHSSYQALPLAF